MQDIDPDILAAIDAGDYPSAELILFDLVSGLYGFWPGKGPLTVDGVVYVGAGSLLELLAVDEGVDLSASALSVKLRAVPEAPLSPDILATIDDETYKGRPVTISTAYFDRITGDIVTVVRMWAGYVDFIDHEGTIGADYTLVGRLEPRSLDHSRRGIRVRGDADQRLLDPDDAFFEHAATTPSEILPYGKATAAPGSTAGGSLPGRGG